LGKIYRTDHIPTIDYSMRPQFAGGRLGS